jgi:transposase
MGEVSTIGLDIAKSVFQIHGVNAAGAVVIRKRITRAKLLEFFVIAGADTAITMTGGATDD